MRAATVPAARTRPGTEASEMFTKTRFSSWDLPDDLQNGLKELGFEFVTEVQWQTVPIARSGRDVIGQARTGSGKTAAFGIPILEACQPTGNLQGLILAPTRELASQVREELESIQGSRGLKILAVYGGTDIEKQARTLQGGVDLIVGTPGRVMDMTKRGYIDLLSPNWFVLDEADRMLDMGFFPDINWVLEKMESRERTLLFSATFPQEILDAAYEFMQDPDFVITNEEKLDIPPIDQFSIRIGRSNKLWALSRVLSVHSGDGQSIVFVNTKRMVDLIIQRLGKVGFEVKALHGDMNQNQRERILGDFREGKVKTIVATDVAARGLDIPLIQHVINYDLPQVPEDYIHRIGRTGRAGKEGSALTFLTPSDKSMWNSISRLIDPSFKFADMEIAEGLSDYWSYPSYPSHIDHILLTSNLIGSLDNPETSIFVPTVDLDFMNWEQYDFLVSDHRPVILNLAY